MPRRGFVPKREVLPDPVYGTTIVTKLINQIMHDGKRAASAKAAFLTGSSTQPCPRNALRAVPNTRNAFPLRGRPPVSDRRHLRYWEGATSFVYPEV